MADRRREPRPRYRPGEDRPPEQRMSDAVLRAADITADSMAGLAARLGTDPASQGGFVMTLAVVTLGVVIRRQFAPNEREAIAAEAASQIREFLGLPS